MMDGFIFLFLSSSFFFCYVRIKCIRFTSHELRAAFRGRRPLALVDFLRGFHS